MTVALKYKFFRQQSCFSNTQTMRASSLYDEYKGEMNLIKSLLVLKLFNVLNKSSILNDLIFARQKWHAGYFQNSKLKSSLKMKLFFNALNFLNLT